MAGYQGCCEDCECATCANIEDCRPCQTCEYEHLEIQGCLDYAEDYSYDNGPYR